MTLYGCSREVYHPLSSRAEPTAVLFYESSDDDDEDLVGLVGNKTPPAVSPKSSPKKTVSGTGTAAPLVVEMNGNAQVQEGGEVTTSGNGNKKELGGGLAAAPSIGRKRIGMGLGGLGTVVRPENTFGDRSPFRKGKGKGRGSNVRGGGQKEGAGNVDDEEEEEEVERKVRIPGSFDFDD